MTQNNTLPSRVASVSADYLQKALETVQTLVPPPQRRISLLKILHVNNIGSLVLNDERAAERLIKELPEGLQTITELQETFHSPQLRQSIASLSAALDSGNFYEIMSNFGLSAGFGTTSGDAISAFLDGIRSTAQANGADADAEAEQI